jgi:hypothetical protein
MHHLPRRFAYLILLLGSLLILHSPAEAQYDYFNQHRDTTKQDSMSEAAPVKIEFEEPAAETIVDPTPEVLEKAILWTRRMMYRGFLDVATTGTWARYAESSWNKTSGSYGPVRAHMTVNYLGATSWMGMPAEHFQTVYRSLGIPKVTVVLDLITSGSAKIDTIRRVLYRVDRGDIQPAVFTLPEGTLDFDRLDQPTAEETKELKMYSGTYEATVYAGSGASAAKVFAYRVADLPPLSLVILGYGEEALIFKSGGDGAEPSFEAPPPVFR